MLARIVVASVLLGVMLLSNVAPAAAVDSAVTVKRFNTSEKVVALTFDAGSDRGYAPQILDTLRDEGVKATFGMTGHWAEQNPDLIQRIVDEGHQLMNHTWTHRSFTGLSSSAAALTTAERQDEILRTASLIRQQTGVELKPYFRPPYGDYDDSVLRDIAAIGYSVNVMWTVDSLGWTGISAEAIINRVISGATPGGNILMHVGGQSQDGPALAAMIEQLRAQGYRFATVDELYTGRVGPTSRLFPETGFEVKGNFLTYWNRFGGLPVFGYPITGERQEEGATVQYFERARFEWHPENAPPWDVLLAHLGRWKLESSQP